jgi:hypothetical protein
MFVGEEFIVDLIVPFSDDLHFHRSSKSEQIVSENVILRDLMC